MKVWFGLWDIWYASFIELDGSLSIECSYIGKPNNNKIRINGLYTLINPHN